jgi:hypothetical protein
MQRDSKLQLHACIINTILNMTKKRQKENKDLKKWDLGEKKVNKYEELF